MKRIDAAQESKLADIRRTREKLDRQQDALDVTRDKLAELFAEGAELGLTQQRMADASDFSQSRVKQLIHGGLR